MNLIQEARAYSWLFYKRFQAAIKQDKRPHVLLIGDSIIHGLHPYLADDLKIKYSISVCRENAQHTRYGLQKLSFWLAQNKKWDLIGFNWGLHDLKRENREAPVQVDIHEYERNLRLLAQKIKEKTPSVFFFTTPPVPAKTQNRLTADVEVYNRVAIDIMKSMDIPVYDLNAYASQRPDLHERSLQQDDVHYTSDGYKRLALFASDAINQEINKIHGVANGKECEKRVA